jgi:hypothetical protein
MDMAQRYLTIALFVLTALTSAVPSRAASDDSRYNIMVPEKGAKSENSEPWLTPKYKSPRGTREHVTVPRSEPAPPVRAAMPPPLVVPETGRVLPNLPTVSGSGPNGAETYQDRAVRCAHQAGVYGQAAGNRSAYVGGCINQ